MQFISVVAVSALSASRSTTMFVEHSVRQHSGETSVREENTVLCLARYTSVMLLNGSAFCGSRTLLPGSHQ